MIYITTLWVLLYQRRFDKTRRPLRDSLCYNELKSTGFTLFQPGTIRNFSGRGVMRTMGHSLPIRWAAAGLLGVLLMGAVPADWNSVPVIAATDSTYATTAEELQAKMAAGLKSRKTSMIVKYKGPTKNLETMLKKAIDGALDSDPYTKYVVDRYSFTWRGTSGTARINLNVNYRETAEESAYVDERVAEILKDIIYSGMNDHQKIKAIHDYVVQNLKYDTDLQKYTAYEGLRTGEAVCQGYTLMTYKLLQGAGFDSRIVEGTAGGQLHAWNLVELEKRWYHIDTTWDDPLSAGPLQVSYEYYMLTDAQMRKDHRWTLKYPAATTLYRDVLGKLADSGKAEAANYKKLQEQLGFGLYDPAAAVATAAELQGQVKQAISRGGLTVTVRYSGTERSLLEDLSSLYDLSIENVKYLSEPLEDTGDLRVEIHWENGKK